MEYRKRCNVCGHIFCYSDQDVKDSNAAKTMTALSAVGTIAAVFGGTRLDAYALDAKGDREQKKIIDFNKCPNCHSTNLSDITDAEYINNGNYQNVQNYSINANATVDSLIKRIEILLEGEEWAKAEAYCEQALDMEPENGQLYYYELLAKQRITNESLLIQDLKIFDEKEFVLAKRYGSPELKDKLAEMQKRAKEQAEERQRKKIEVQIERELQRKKAICEKCKKIIESENSSISEIETVVNKLKEISEFEDSQELILLSENKLVELKAKSKERRTIAIKRATVIGSVILVIVVCCAILIPIVKSYKDKLERYNIAIGMKESGNVLDALSVFEDNPGFKDSKNQIEEIVNALHDEYSSAVSDGNYSTAIKCISGIKNYGYEKEYKAIQEDAYNQAFKLVSDEKYLEANELFNVLEDYEDSENWKDYTEVAVRVISPSQTEKIDLQALNMEVRYINDANLRLKLMGAPLFAKIKTLSSMYTRLKSNGDWDKKYYWIIDTAEFTATDSLIVDPHPLVFYRGDYYLEYIDDDCYEKIVKSDANTMTIYEPILDREEKYKKTPDYY